MKAVALFNDNGRTHHAGCLAVSAAHMDMLARAGARVEFRHFLGEYSGFAHRNWRVAKKMVLDSELRGELERADAVIVNGEGTIHHGAGLHLLAILGAAIELGKPALLVNCVMQEIGGHFETLHNLTDFTVRDAGSSEYLASLGIKHRVVVDSIMEAPFVDTPAHDWTGKVVITDWHEARNGDVGAAVGRLIEQLGDRAVFFPLDHPDRLKDWRSIVADMKRADAVVTGRHHGVCMAGLAGVAFLALGSNTWKIEGMMRLFGPDLRVSRPRDDLYAQLNTALADPSPYRRFSRAITSCCPLSTFAAIAESDATTARSAVAATSLAAPPTALDRGVPELPRIAYLESTCEWLELQVADYRSAAAKLATDVNNLREWADKLEEARTWHEEQLKHARTEHEGLNRTIADLRNFAEKLEEGREWYRTQAENWRTEAQSGQQVIANLSGRVEQLEGAIRQLEAERNASSDGSSGVNTPRAGL